MMENEVPKYKKKKDSNTSKAKRKSNHNHEIKECVIITKENDMCVVNYCTTCGKIVNVNNASGMYYFEHISHFLNHYDNKQSFLSKFKDLPKFMVNKLSDDCVGEEITDEYS